MEVNTVWERLKEILINVFLLVRVDFSKLFFLFIDWSFQSGGGGFIIKSVYS